MLKRCAFVLSAESSFSSDQANYLQVTRESHDDQEALENDYPSAEGDSKDVIYQWVKETIRGTEGMPIGIQVIGRPWQEETVIAAMKQIQLAINKHSVQ